jgi:hypothetical protein
MWAATLSVVLLVATALARGDKPSEVLVGALFPFAEDGYLYSGDATERIDLSLFPHAKI